MAYPEQMESAGRFGNTRTADAICTINYITITINLEELLNKLQEEIEGLKGVEICPGNCHVQCGVQRTICWVYSSNGR